MNEINYELVKFIDNEFELEVNVSPKEDTIWLSLDEMALLYERDRSVIGKHIRKIYSNNELDENRTRAKNARHLDDNRIYQVDVYNLDVIIAVGYCVNSKRGTIFRQWASKILKEYLLKGYIVNESRTLVTNENYVNLINKVDSMNNRIGLIENKLNSNIYNPKKVFVSGEYYDAYTYIQSVFQSANKKIIIIDNYVDRSVLDRLTIKKKEVKVIIFTKDKILKLIEEDVLKFNIQYGNLELKDTNKSHDRFIIIDDNDLYHLGASIKDLGNKIFAIEKLDSYLIETIINNL